MPIRTSGTATITRSFGGRQLRKVPLIGSVTFAPGDQPAEWMSDAQVEAIHVYIGFLCLLLALILFRRRLSSFTALIPGIVVSITMEIFDLRDGYGWAASLKDLVNTNLIPFLLVLLTRWRTFNV